MMEINAFEISYIVLASVLTPAVLFSSVAVIGVALKGLKQPNSARVFILSQATADSIQACLLPIHCTAILTHNSLMCIVTTKTLFYLSGVILLSIAALGLERFSFFTNPEKYNAKLTKLKRVVLVTFIWLYPLVHLVVPVIIYWNAVGLIPVEMTCTMDVIGGRPYFVFFLLMVFPAYVEICYNLSQMIRNIPTVHSDARSCTKKYVLVVFLYVLALALIVLPQHVYLAFASLGTEIQNLTVLHYFLFCASLIALVNPWFYAQRENNNVSNLSRVYFGYLTKSNTSIHVEEPTVHIQSTVDLSTDIPFQRQTSLDDSGSLQDDVFDQSVEWVKKSKRSSASSIMSRQHRISGGSIVTNTGKVLTVPCLVLEDIEGVSSCDIPIDVPEEAEVVTVSSASIDLHLSIDGSNGSEMMNSEEN